MDKRARKQERKFKFRSVSFLRAIGRQDKLALRMKWMADPTWYGDAEDKYRRAAIIRDTSRIYLTL